MVKSRWVYRKLRNFRAGIEAGISYLNRAYGLGRYTWRGFDHFRPYVWSSVVAYNLPSSPGSGQPEPSPTGRKSPRSFSAVPPRGGLATAKRPFGSSRPDQWRIGPKSRAPNRRPTHVPHQKQPFMDAN
jgi:IS5 family transposase